MSPNRYRELGKISKTCYNRSMSFTPNMTILPQPQQALWQELGQTPQHFTLYGGTALALHLGHRESIDFDFFSPEPIDGNDLLGSIPYLDDAEVRDIKKNSLTCYVDRGGLVKMQYFGNLPLGHVEPRHELTNPKIGIASLIDVAGSKIKVVSERSEAKDYIDIDALIRHGVELPQMIAAASVIYGKKYNPILSLKALSYFGDVDDLDKDIAERLKNAVAKVDLNKIPAIKTTYKKFQERKAP